MKTDTLIEMLARQAGPAPAFPVGRRLAVSAGLGLLASSSLALILIGPLPVAFFLYDRAVDQACLLRTSTGRGDHPSGATVSTCVIHDTGSCSGRRRFYPRTDCWRSNLDGDTEKRAIT